MKNIELNKLLVLLARAGIPFEVFPYSLCGEYYFQICYPDKENCVVDAVSTPYTYGGKTGLSKLWSVIGKMTMFTAGLPPTKPFNSSIKQMGDNSPIFLFRRFTSKKGY